MFIGTFSLVCLNPFYIMEGILIEKRSIYYVLGVVRLNPFYIMEGILIKKENKHKK